jgi:hypothetical protein
MDSSIIETRTWAEEQFGRCDLGDERRTKRMIAIAATTAENPSASFPLQFATWSDLKAAYRLFDSEDVTFSAIAKPHWQSTRARGPGRYLVIGDTTEIDFGVQRQVEGLGPTGNGGGYGFLLHSALMVGADSEEIIGLAAQTIHYRQPAPKHENTTQRLQRDRESEVWGKVIDQVGPAPEGAEFVHVLDRGADNFEVFCHLYEQRVACVVRASQLTRNISTPSGQILQLQRYFPTLAIAGTYALELRVRPQQAARTAQLEVRFGKMQMLMPAHKSPYVQRINPGAITMTMIWVREIDRPKGVDGIEWVLYSSLPVTTLANALVVIAYYEKRWLIEEWHKALKTGCQVESRQLKSSERLEAMIGLMSVIAVRLLQLKSVARTDPERPAKKVVPELWIDMLAASRKLKGTDKTKLTIYKFYRELAKLGGFLGRKHDGEPGWITLWRGWEKLNVYIRGYEIGQQLDRKRSG